MPARSGEMSDWRRAVWIGCPLAMAILDHVDGLRNILVIHCFHDFDESNEWVAPAREATSLGSVFICGIGERWDRLY